MKLKTLHDLLVLEVQDLYDGEQQITQAMPQMIDVTTSPELKESFEKHLDETRGQIEKLERVAKELGIDPNGKSCLGMEGIIEEGVELMQENEPSEVLDAALLAASQKVEHYEIAGYGTACTYAKMMGHQRVFELLSEILNEEKSTDLKLTDLAKRKENLEALNNTSGMKAM
jgi:ferritin-like metal-binding protein YciE